MGGSSSYAFTHSLCSYRQAVGLPTLLPGGKLCLRLTTWLACRTCSTMLWASPLRLSLISLASSRMTSSITTSTPSKIVMTKSSFVTFRISSASWKPLARCSVSCSASTPFLRMLPSKPYGPFGALRVFTFTLLKSKWLEPLA